MSAARHLGADEGLELLQDGRLLLATATGDDVLLRVALAPEDPFAPPYVVGVLFEGVGDRFSAVAEATPVERPDCTVDLGTILEVARDGERCRFAGDFGVLELEAAGILLALAEEDRVSLPGDELVATSLGGGTDGGALAAALAGTEAIATVLVETEDETAVTRIHAGADSVVVMTPDVEATAVTTLAGDALLPVLLEATRLNVHFGLLGAVAEPVDTTDDELLDLVSARVRIRILHLEGHEAVGGELEWLDLGAAAGALVVRPVEESEPTLEPAGAAELLEELLTYLPGRVLAV